MILSLTNKCTNKINENNNYILIDSCIFAVNRYKRSEDSIQLKESTGVNDQWSHD